MYWGVAKLVRHKTLDLAYPGSNPGAPGLKSVVSEEWLVNSVAVRFIAQNGKSQRCRINPTATINGLVPFFDL